MKKFIVGATVVGWLASTIVASAHVVVKPASVGVGAFQTFTMGVPSEKNSSTMSLKLMIPAGLKYVTPNVKPGWRITEKKIGEGEAATVTEIDWTGGAVPAGQRDEFVFSAQVPSASSTLQWKAYQTYADGSVVSWDHAPSTTAAEFSTYGPYSETKIINDLAATSMTPDTDMDHGSGTASTALTFSLVALALSIVSLVAVRKAKKV